MMKHLSVKIYGRVQGVFFRTSAREQAKSLGLTGFVRNEADGSVYIEAEGEEPALEKFLAWCRQGPSSAKVENVESKIGGNLNNFRSFAIK